MDPYEEILAEIAAGAGVAVIQYDPVTTDIKVAVRVGGLDPEDKADVEAKRAAVLPLLPADLELARLAGAKGNDNLIFSTIDIALERAGQPGSPN